MIKLLNFSFVIVLSVFAASVVYAGDDIIVNSYAAKKFASLPDGVAYPEGITADPKSGQIYVGTFNPGGTNKLLRFSPYGQLLAQREFGSTPLLGLAFNPTEGKVYICNAGALVGGTSMVQRIDAGFDDTTTVEDVADIPSIGPPGPQTIPNPDGTTDTIEYGAKAPAPNALVFDKDGNVYISDSFQGAIFKIEDPAANCPGTGCAVNTVAHDGQLATAGFPPFGANGLALSETGDTLFIANTGDDRVLMLDFETRIISTFAESINGADGIAFDSRGNLWVAANQADRVIVLDEFGRVIAKLGDFLGIKRDASPRGLLFPASLVIQREWVFVTNLSLPLTTPGGDEPEEDIQRYTVSRIKSPWYDYGKNHKH